MGDNEQELDNDNVLVFDHFYTNNHIRIMKSLLPYIDSPASSMLPVLIKYMELRYTIALAKSGVQPFAHCNVRHVSSADTQTVYQDIYHDVRRYLSPDEEHSFARTLNMLNMMSNARQMQQMMELVQGMSGAADGTEPCMGDMSALAGMMGGDMDPGLLMELLRNMQ